MMILMQLVAALIELRRFFLAVDGDEAAASTATTCTAEAVAFALRRAAPRGDV